MVSQRLPTSPKDRFDVYRFFDGATEESNSAKTQGRLPLVKTFLLEHVSAQAGKQQKPIIRIFESLDCRLIRIDETFWSVLTKDNIDGKIVESAVGYLETYDSRFFAFYTVERSDIARKLITKWVNQSSDLDNTWFSSQLLQTLWNQDVQHRGVQRFGRLVFKYDGIFEMNESGNESEDDDTSEVENETEDDINIERRKARFEMGDRIGRIRSSLEKLQNEYEPLHALYSLRFPSQTNYGSHDLYQYGQVTNRSTSFLDHRNTVRYLYKAYNTVLEETEEVAWASNEQTSIGPKLRLKGVPLIGEPLI